MTATISQRLTSFLLRSIEKDDEFAISVISKFYPFTQDELSKYSGRLSWSCVAMNENILWSKEFYEIFKDKIPLVSLSANEKFPWTEDFIETNFNELFYYQGEPNNTSSNGALPWSIAFIEKYKEHWEWWWLSLNRGIPFTKELINRFKDYWDWDELLQNKRIQADEVLRKHFNISPPVEHECIFCYKDRYYVIEQRKFSLKLMADCPYFRWDRKLYERINVAINIGKLHPSCIGYLDTSFIFKWNMDAFEVFEEHLNYTMLTVNDIACNFIVDVIKKYNLLEEILAKLPSIDFENRRYNISLDTPDDPTDSKIGLN